MGESLFLRCKDFDSWISMLGRISKIGHNYILKNNIYIATERNYKADTQDKYPGRHMIKDPFFINEEDAYVADGTYIVTDLEEFIKRVSTVEDSVEDCRKDIEYIRNKNEVLVRMGSVTIPFATLLTEEPSTEVKSIADSITWYGDLIDSVGRTDANHWVSFTDLDLIHLRNDGIHPIEHTVGDRVVKTRLARSLFCLAGVSRKDTPLAKSACYTALPSDQSDVAMLRINAIYKCGQSTKVVVDCIHEYLVLMY